MEVGVLRTVAASTSAAAHAHTAAAAATPPPAAAAGNDADDGGGARRGSKDMVMTRKASIHVAGEVFDIADESYGPPETPTAGHKGPGQEGEGRREGAAGPAGADGESAAAGGAATAGAGGGGGGVSEAQLTALADAMTARIKVTFKVCVRVWGGRGALAGADGGGAVLEPSAPRYIHHLSRCRGLCFATTTHAPTPAASSGPSNALL